MKPDDSDSSFNWSSEDEEYDWAEFTRSKDGLRAPREAFNQPSQTPINTYEKGQILMSTDRNLIMDGLFVAQVESVYKCFVNINIVEIGRKFWTICDNDCLSPFIETSLRRHPDNSRTDKAWEKWLARFMEDRHDNIAPNSAFERNQFKVGMVLAYLDDHTFTGKLSPAIVVEVKSSGMITLERADHNSKTLVTLKYSDRRLFPIEFVKEAQIPVRSGNKKKKALKSTYKLPTKNKKTVSKEPPKKKGRPKGSKNSTIKKTVYRKINVTVANSSFYSNARSSRSLTPETVFCPKRTSTPKTTRGPSQKTAVRNKKKRYEENSVEDTRSSDIVQQSSDDNLPTTSSSFCNSIAQVESSILISPNNENMPDQEIVSPIPTEAPQAANCFKALEENRLFVPSLDSLVENTKLFRLQRTWLLNCNTPGFTPDKVASSLPLMSMLQTVQSNRCIASPNSSASVGPLLSWIALREALATLPPMHYKIQFYNVISALIKSGKTVTSVFENIGYSHLEGNGNFSIYATCNDRVQAKHFSWPQSYQNACKWLKFYLKQIQADETLITLQQI